MARKNMQMTSTPITQADIGDKKNLPTDNGTQKA